MKLNWHGFLDQVVSPERAKQPSCGLIFSDAPFSKDETWDIVEVQVAPFGLEALGWIMDPVDSAAILREAKENQKTRIGNVHTHIVFDKETDPGWTLRTPPRSLKRQALCTPKCPNCIEDLVRGVITVVFPPVMQHYDPTRQGYRVSGRIENASWHDKFGEQLNLGL